MLPQDKSNFHALLFFPTRAEFHRLGNSGSPREKCHLPFYLTPQGFLQQRFCSPEERGWRTPCPKLERIQPIRNLQTFQNGKHSPASRPPVGERLDGQTRFEGRLSVRSNFRPASQISSIPMEERILRISGPALRPVIGTVVFHETDETGGRTSEAKRGKVDHLSGRHHSARPDPRDCLSPLVLDGPTPSGPRVHHKPGQVGFDRLSIDGIPRVSARLSDLPAVFTTTKK